MNLYLVDNFGIYQFNSTFNNTYSGYLNVSFVDKNCSLEIRVGNITGPYTYIFNLTNHGCNISSQIQLTLNTSNIQLYLPEKLSIRDINYNTSKTDNINVIVTRMLRAT
jgi:hypothetical protein